MLSNLGLGLGLTGRINQGGGAAITPDIYLDPVGGSDSNDGLTSATPIQTSAGFMAHDAFGDGVTLAIKAGPQVMRDGFDFAEPNAGNGNTTLSDFTVIGYGSGPPRKISCLDIADNGDFAAHGSIANAYTIAWDHELYATATGRFRVFEDDEPLKRVETEAGTSVAGTYWYDTVTTPGTPATIVVHPYGNTNPASDGKVYEITKRQYAVSGRDNCHFEYLHGYANGNNNGSFFAYANPTFKACVAEQGTKHNWVVGPGTIEDVISVNCWGMTGEYCPDGAAMGTVFINDPAGADATLTRCGFIVDGSPYTGGGSVVASPFYAHGAASSLGSLTFTDCWDGGTTLGGTAEAPEANFNNYFSNGRTGNNQGVFAALASSVNVTVRGGLFRNNPRAFSVGNIDIEGAVFIRADNGAGAMVFGANDFRFVGNYYLESDATVPAISTASTGKTIEIEGNIFSKVYQGLSFSGTAATSITSDSNYWDRYDVEDGNGGRYIGSYLGVNYSFADWQGQGFDLNSVNGVNPSADWLSGSHPTPDAIDIRLDPTGPAYALLNPLGRVIPQAQIDAYLARPLTRADALDYIENDAPRSELALT